MHFDILTQGFFNETFGLKVRVDGGGTRGWEQHPELYLGDLDHRFFYSAVDRPWAQLRKGQHSFLD